jgi:hypothetical protein
MGFKIKEDEEKISHKIEIIRLIRKTNNTIAEFDESPTLINEYTKQTTYIEQAQRGKRIALAVRTLLINSRSILPPQFFTNLKINNTYKKAYQKPYKFLAENATQQYEGILDILEFYQELLDALYALPDFSDIQNVNTKKYWREKAEVTEEYIDEVFKL